MSQGEFTTLFTTLKYWLRYYTEINYYIGTTKTYWLLLPHAITQPYYTTALIFCIKL